ncbi:MAG: 50S ribosomal protein L10 [Victivallales bacterium]|nr:50S ribosomal protein L10 [Victivallales bacterium]
MRNEKIQMVQEVASLLEGKSAILISYQGISANQLNGFRAKIGSDELKGTCRVVPNTLVKKAAEKLGYTALAEATLKGDTALVSGPDPVSLVKAIKEFAKESAKDKQERVKIKMAYVEGALLNTADALALGDLPPKEAIQAQILGLLQAPASGIVRAINAKIASIVYVLNAFKAKKEQETA